MTNIELAVADKENLIRELWAEIEDIDEQLGNSPFLTERQRETLGIRRDEVGTLLDELEFGGRY